MNGSYVHAPLRNSVNEHRTATKKHTQSLIANLLNDNFNPKMPSTPPFNAQLTPRAADYGATIKYH